MKIAVLAGGLSPERDVSLSSGAKIANALCLNGHLVAYTDIYKTIDLNSIPSMFTDKAEYSYSIPKCPPDLERLKAESGLGERLIGFGIIELCKYADIVFLALHGGMGEDGRMQAFLETLGIKHTGSGWSSCHAAMDKAISKYIFRNSGVPTADWILWQGGKCPDVKFPCVVKPTSCGSSVGVSMPESVPELCSSLDSAVSHGGKVIIEDKIIGREFSVGILNGRALPAIEIRPKSGFYDFERKYQSGETDEICPAPITENEARTLGELALKAHNALGLGSYSRLDFIKEEKTGIFYCLEANALPGMTPASLLPQEAAAVGISYGELCEMIVNAAV